jgi:hypothetical protein
MIRKTFYNKSFVILREAVETKFLMPTEESGKVVEKKTVR